MDDEESDFEFSSYSRLVGVSEVSALADVALSSGGWLIGISGVLTLTDVAFSSYDRVSGVPALPDAEGVLVAELKKKQLDE